MTRPPSSPRPPSAHLTCIASALANTGSDFWTERMDALKTLERLTLGGACGDYRRAFLDVFKQVRSAVETYEARTRLWIDGR